MVSSLLSSNKTETEEIPVYQYQQQAVVDYKVNLLPNSFYQEEALGSEQPAYLMSLTDSIDTILNYNFESEKSLDYEGQYSITGAVKAYTRLDKDHEVVMWQKDYVYVSNTKFSGNDKIISFTDSVNVPMQSYVQDLKQFEEAAA